MRKFRVAYTGDFLNEDGNTAYGDLDLARLEQSPFVEHRFLTRLSPHRGDSEYWQRLYSLEVRPDDVQGTEGLVVLRPWVKERTLAAASELIVIGRSGAGYDKIDVEACTKHNVALFNAPLALNHATAS